jgi:hypothetical protein
VVVLVLLAGAVIAIARRSVEPACEWSQATADRHKAAVAGAPDAAVRALTVGAPVLGDSLGIRRGTESDSTSAFRNFAPAACFALEVNVSGTPGSRSLAREPYRAAARVVVLSSSRAVDRYVADDSFLAARVREHRPGGVFAALPLPQTRAVVVGEHDGWAVACLFVTGSACEGWNLLARSDSCPSIVVDLKLDIGRAVHGRTLDQADASAVLEAVAEETLAVADAALAAAPCAGDRLT